MEVGVMGGMGGWGGGKMRMRLSIGYLAHLRGGAP